jgi:hypothetical protein
LVNIKTPALNRSETNQGKFPSLISETGAMMIRATLGRKVLYLLEISRDILASAKIGEREHNSPIFKCLEIFYLY